MYEDRTQEIKEAKEKLAEATELLYDILISLEADVNNTPDELQDLDEFELAEQHVDVLTDIVENLKEACSELSMEFL